MAKRPLPTPTELRQLLRYDPETGLLYRVDGREALNYLMPNGYLTGTVLGRTVWAHRAAWAVHHGKWPKCQIDHINGVKTDNRLANLRDVTAAENKRNSPRYKNNPSGVTGVRWHEPRKEWRVWLGKRQIGAFADFDAAVAARKNAEREGGYSDGHGRD